MRLQQLIYKVEELKALSNLYDQATQALAQGATLQAAMGEESSAEDKAAVTEKLEQLSARVGNITKLLMERTGASDEDGAIEKIQEHMARLQHYQQIRGEQLQLRTQLDVELAMGEVAPETRQQAEATLQSMQSRLEMLVQQGEQAIPGPRLISLA